MPAALDLAIVSPQRLDILEHSSQELGYAAESYEVKKRLHLQTEQQCTDQGIHFVPLVAERSGGWGPTALTTFVKLARAISQRTGEGKNKILAHHLEELSVRIRRSKARATLKRCPQAADDW